MAMILLAVLLIDSEWKSWTIPLIKYALLSLSPIQTAL